MKQNICKSFLLECMEGIHDFSVDQFKLALYTAGANLNPLTTTVYTTFQEAAGTGYVAGGFALVPTAGFPRLAVSSNKALMDFQDINVEPAFFASRFGLIYNFSKANRAVATINFGLNYYSTVNFRLVWPPNDDDNCLIRLGA